MAKMKIQQTKCCVCGSGNKTGMIADAFIWLAIATDSNDEGDCLTPRSGFQTDRFSACDRCIGAASVDIKRYIDKRLKILK